MRTSLMSIGGDVGGTTFVDSFLRRESGWINLNEGRLDSPPYAKSPVSYCSGAHKCRFPWRSV